MSDEPHGVVVDAHAHLFTHSFFQALARQAGKLLPPGDELQAIHERTGVEIAAEPLKPLAARWVQEMDRNRIQRMVLMSSIAGDHKSSTAAARLHPNRIIPYQSVVKALPRRRWRATELSGGHCARAVRGW